MKRFIIKTLGCKVNQCESEAIANSLMESGEGCAAGEDGVADVVIINTCTVTGKAAMQSRQAVRQAIRHHPGARIVVTGCHAQTAPQELSAIGGVDLIVGNRDKHRLPHMLSDETVLPWSDGPPASICPDIAAESRFAELPAIAHGGRTRPFLKIQDGCNAFCTYCIVPHARGRSRSLPLDQVLEQIDRLGRLGYREVVLTGIHIGCYGQDLTPKTGLYDLLCRIRDAGRIERVRISSIEPAELTEAIVGLAASAEDRPGRLCRHFHIPLQSGDDAILRRMNRPYGRDLFERLVRRIVTLMPDAAVGVDTLIGFPGESVAAFENTYDLIQSLPVAYLHVFPFSARRGTPAYSFDDPVPASVIKTRCQQMRRLGSQKRSAFYRRTVGRRVTVLVEDTRDSDNGGWKGLTDNYIPVHFTGPDDLGNTFRHVAVERLSGSGVPEGRLVEEEGPERW